MPLLEIATFNPRSAQIACTSGASRIELCTNPALGGTTPPPHWLPPLKSNNVPIFIMIRPLSGAFNPTAQEFQSMESSIDEFKAAGADGFVFGILGADGRVDVDRTRALVTRAVPLPCTFHRAIDETKDLLGALEDVVRAGCHAVLSSGGAASASDGVEGLQAMVERAAGRVVVIPGGGVRGENLAWIRERTGAEVFHSSALSEGSEWPDSSEIQRMKQLLV